MKISAVLAGAEAFYAEGGSSGVLISHGFTGSPQSMRELGERFAEAGFSVALPRLTGHGTTPADMMRSSALDWVKDIHTAANWLKERCDSLYMTGLSMGGTLTLYMAGQYPDLFKAIAPINATVFLNSPGLASLALNPEAPEIVQAVGGDIKKPGIVELAYTATPVASIKELLLLMKVSEELLPSIKSPALIITSREDHVVPPANAEYIQSHISSQEKRILWLDNSYHVATLDNDKETILAETMQFFQAHP